MSAAAPDPHTPAGVAPAVAHADDAAIDEVRAAWGACTEMLDAAPDDWTGWRRNFDGGYADHFEFNDGGDDSTSVLVQTWLIDAIATQTDVQTAVGAVLLSRFLDWTGGYVVFLYGTAGSVLLGGLMFLLLGRAGIAGRPVAVPEAAAG